MRGQPCKCTGSKSSHERNKKEEKIVDLKLNKRHYKLPSSGLFGKGAIRLGHPGLLQGIRTGSFGGALLLSATPELECKFVFAFARGFRVHLHIELTSIILALGRKTILAWVGVSLLLSSLCWRHL